MKIYRIEATNSNTIQVTGDTGISSNVPPDELSLHDVDIFFDNPTLNMVIAPTDSFSPTDLIYAHKYMYSALTGESSAEKAAREWLKEHIDYDVIIIGIDTAWINTSTNTWWVSYHMLKDRWLTVGKPIY